MTAASDDEPVVGDLDTFTERRSGELAATGGEDFVSVDHDGGDVHEVCDVMSPRSCLTAGRGTTSAFFSVR